MSDQSGFKSVDRHSVADQVREQILKYLWGNFQPNKRLPSERELAETMEVSRSAIREVLQGLVLESVLETRQGGGYFIRRLGPETLLQSSAFSLFFGNPELDQLHEARSVLEVATARLAASRATLSEIQGMGRLVGEAESLIAAGRVDTNELVRLGWAFHGAIAKASHNEVLYKQHGVIALIADRRHRSSGAYESYPYSYDANAHRELWQLISKRSRERAGQAMEERLERTYRLLETTRMPGGEALP